MNNNDMIFAIQNFDWQELIQSLNKSAVKNHIRILISAIIETFHPDEECKKKFSLSSCWDEKLANIALTKIHGEISGRVSLHDFYNAYLQAKLIYEKNQSALAKVKSALMLYVQENKLFLCGVLNDCRFPNYNSDITNIFGPFDLTPMDESKFNERVQKSRSEVEKYVKHIEEHRVLIARELEQFFGLASGSCQLSPGLLDNNIPDFVAEKNFDLPAGTAYIHAVQHLAELDYSELYFISEDKAEIDGYVKSLRDLGIAIYCSHYNSFFGPQSEITIHSSLKDVLAKLSKALNEQSLSLGSMKT